jgi:hypothetical protein
LSCIILVNCLLEPSNMQVPFFLLVWKWHLWSCFSLSFQDVFMNFSSLQNRVSLLLICFKHLNSASCSEYIRIENKIVYIPLWTINMITYSNRTTDRNSKSISLEIDIEKLRLASLQQAWASWMQVYNFYFLIIWASISEKNCNLQPSYLIRGIPMCEPQPDNNLLFTL